MANVCIQQVCKYGRVLHLCVYVRHVCCMYTRVHSTHHEFMLGPTTEWLIVCYGTQQECLAMSSKTQRPCASYDDCLWDLQPQDHLCTEQTAVH